MFKSLILQGLFNERQLSSKSDDHDDDQKIANSTAIENLYQWFTEKKIYENITSTMEMESDLQPVGQTDSKITRLNTIGILTIIVIGLIMGVGAATFLMKKLGRFPTQYSAVGNSSPSVVTDDSSLTSDFIDNPPNSMSHQKKLGSENDCAPAYRHIGAELSSNTNASGASNNNIRRVATAAGRLQPSQMTLLGV